ncbi:hypothetical protein [Paracidovorax konjaci]|uniref:Nickel transport protein n=1 Tax=Paracidovorax konjaci TaxID=32040 RepID=A0A1I1T0K7_9BURK|nr:hypothetical protein [Paracidovorax konjaci]SFD52162.1 hypothetical protein SAMN04489710_10340 [Paracidovorax konjaci]
MKNSLLLTRAWSLAVALALLPAWSVAHEGHDDEAPVATGAGMLPRFTAVSDAFELVGVLDGQRLSLYLDHAADNRPAEGARLDLEINGHPVALNPSGGDGRFEALLPAPLPEGEAAVAAVVAVGTASDVLAGTFDIHGPEGSGPESAGSPWRTRAPWIAGAVLALALAAVALRRRAGSGRRNPIGGAA